MNPPQALSDADLDALYTRLCRELTACGEAQAPLLLARFALLAMLAIGERPRLEQMIDAARAGLAAAPDPA
jgi:hypothetical protein